MDPVAIGLIALLGVLGAAIAYGADVLGRSLGKKRLTIGNLRPRHTAALVTTLAGFVIPIGVTFVLYFLSADVRTWIDEGRGAVAERNRLLQRLEEARREYGVQMDCLQASVKDLEGRSAEAERRVQTAQEKAREAETEVGRLRATEAELRASSESLRKNVTALTKEYDDLKRASAELRATNERYAIQNAEIGRQNIELDQQLVATKRNLDAARKDLADTEGRLTDVQRELETARLQYASAVKNFAEESERAQRELERTKLDLDAARGELSRLQAMSQAMVQSLDVNLRLTRTQPLMFEGGDEVVRQSLPANLGPKEAQDWLTGVLRSARLTTRERGATPSRGGSAEAGLIDLPMESGGVITVDMQQESIVRSITGVPEQSVLICYSFWNTFKGEFVPLRIDALRNPVVFQKSDIVAEARIRGDQSEDAILGEIRKFLVERVREAALKAKMIPASGREQQFGTVTSETMLELVQLVKSTNRTVRLVALAANETRAADPLRLEFRIR